MERLRPVVMAFDEGIVANAGDDVPAGAYQELLTRVPALQAEAVALAESETPGEVASAAELILEGLHLSKRLNKDAAGARTAYRGRG